MNILVLIVTVVTPTFVVGLLAKKLRGLFANQDNRRLSQVVLTLTIAILPIVVAVTLDKLDLSAALSRIHSDDVSDNPALIHLAYIEANSPPHLHGTIEKLRQWIYGALSVTDNGGTGLLALLGLSFGVFVAAVVANYLNEESVASIIQGYETSIVDMTAETESTVAAIAQEKQVIERSYDSLAVADRISNKILQSERIRIAEALFQHPIETTAPKDCQNCVAHIQPVLILADLVAWIHEALFHQISTSESCVVRVALFVPHDDHLVVIGSYDNLTRDARVSSPNGRNRKWFSLKSDRSSLAVWVYLGKVVGYEDFACFQSQDELEGSEYFSYFDEAEKDQIKSLLAIRLKVREPAEFASTAGVLVVDANQENYFDEADIGRALEMSDDIALRVDLELKKLRYYNIDLDELITGDGLEEVAGNA